MNDPLNSLHKSTSVLRQPYAKNSLKHFSENLLAILLILITVSSLAFAAANFFCQRKTPVIMHENNILIPAIYVQDVEAESLNL